MVTVLWGGKKIVNTSIGRIDGVEVNRHGETRPWVQ